MSSSKKLGRNNRFRSSIRRSSRRRRRRFKVFRLGQLFRRVKLFPGLLSRMKSDPARLFPELQGKVDVILERLFRKLEKRGRTSRRGAQQFRANAQQVNAISYENLEARQLLAADLMIGLSGTELTITDVAGINNNLTVQVSGATTTISTPSAIFGEFDAMSLPTGLTLNSDSTALTFDTADVSSVVVDAAGGADTLTATNVDSSDFDLTFTGGGGTDDYFLNSSTLAALDPGGANLLTGETLYACLLYTSPSPRD